MDFINNNILEVFKQLYPLGMMGQDTGVQHIRVRHDDMACLAYCPPGRSRGIPIVGVCFNILPQLGDNFIKLRHLVRREALCGKQV